MRLTQKQIDELDSFHKESSRLARDLGIANSKFYKLRRQCDHEYSDGSDACSYDPAGRHCEICKRFI